MLKFIGKLPVSCTVAFSGGVDSVAITDFLLRGKRNVQLAFFDHGTETSRVAKNFARGFAEKRKIPFVWTSISVDRAKNLSLEEYWRIERYKFLTLFPGSVITCHHLNDAVETWIFSALHGRPTLIPYARDNVIRPFLITPKSELVSWAERHGLSWHEDTSNRDVQFARNRIRHNIVPEALKINPGLATVIRKKYLSQEATA